MYKSSIRKTFLFTSLLHFLAAGFLFAQVSDIQVHDKELDARIVVAGVYSADLSIVFENVVGLTENSLVISAAQISAADLLNRLSEPSFINLAGQFPVMISITPSASSNLTFTGIVTIGVHTSNLTYSSSLRLFSAPAGGVFEDITGFSGTGSYRASGTKPRFSDFLIATDMRDSNTVIQSKFDQLQQSLNSNASRIEANMLQNLQSQLTAARTAYQTGSKIQAISGLNAMIDTIKSDNGVSIPNVYRANDLTTINAAGELRSRADTLIFTLQL